MKQSYAMWKRPGRTDVTGAYLNKYSYVKSISLIVLLYLHYITLSRQTSLFSTTGPDKFWAVDYHEV